MRIVYIADDGKEFDNEFECEHYEWLQNHPNLKYIKCYNEDGKLFDDIKFPVGKKSEDWFIMYKLIEKADGIYYSSVPCHNGRNCCECQRICDNTALQVPRAGRYCRKNR